MSDITLLPPKDFLQAIYEGCLAKIGTGDTIKTDLDITDIKLLEVMIKYSSKKGATTVLITSLVYKALHPQQDIRKHQDSMDGGYSGRTFDFTYVTPFLKSVQFTAAAESGWLSRSFETKDAYTLDYPAGISPAELKTAFLNILDRIEKNILSPVGALEYFFQGLVLQRNKRQIELAMPMGLTISKISDVLSAHFTAKYFSDGASRLPTLAIYAVYQCLINETKRFENKKLLPIESHTSADSRSGRIGDIQVDDASDSPFEAVEVKHGIPVSLQLVKDAFSKFSKTQVKRYYILSTLDVLESERTQITNEIEKIKNVHGCHLIANGLNKTMLYYLRLVNEPSDFIKYYVRLIEIDGALKFEHKEKWNELISGLVDSPISS